MSEIALSMPAAAKSHQEAKCTCHGEAIRQLCARTKPYSDSDHKVLVSMLRDMSVDTDLLRKESSTGLTRLKGVLIKALFHTRALLRLPDVAEVHHLDAEESKNMELALASVSQDRDGFFSALSTRDTSDLVVSLLGELSQAPLDRIHLFMRFLKPEVLKSILQDRRQTLGAEQLDAVVEQFVVPGEMDAVRIDLVRSFGKRIETRVKAVMPELLLSEGDFFPRDAFDDFMDRVLKIEPGLQMTDSEMRMIKLKLPFGNPWDHPWVDLPENARANAIAAVLTNIGMYLDPPEVSRRELYFDCAVCFRPAVFDGDLKDSDVMESFESIHRHSTESSGTRDPVCSRCWADRYDTRSHFRGDAFERYPYRYERLEAVVDPMIEQVFDQDMERLERCLEGLRLHF